MCNVDGWMDGWMDGLMIYDSIIPIDLVVVIVVTNWETSNMIV